MGKMDLPYAPRALNTASIKWGAVCTKAVVKKSNLHDIEPSRLSASLFEDTAESYIQAPQPLSWP